MGRRNKYVRFEPKFQIGDKMRITNNGDGTRGVYAVTCLFCTNTTFDFDFDEVATQIEYVLKLKEGIADRNLPLEFIIDEDRFEPTGKKRVFRLYKNGFLYLIEWL